MNRFRMTSPAEDDGMFSVVTGQVQKLVEFKRSGTRIREDTISKFTEALGKLLKKNYCEEQRQMSGAAIVLSARVVLPNTSMLEKISMLPWFRLGMDMVGNLDNLPACKWNNLEPLYLMYLEAIPHQGDEFIAKEFVKFLATLIQAITIAPAIQSDFYSLRSCVSIARIVINSLDIIGHPGGDIELRKLTMDLLHEVLLHCPRNRVPTIALFASGLLSGLVKILNQNTNDNAILTEKMLELFNFTTVLVFSDGAEKFDISQVDLKEHHKELRVLFEHQSTDAWREKALDSIKQFTEHLLSLYMVHRVDSIRAAMCDVMINIQRECAEFFGGKLYESLLGMYMHLKYDDFEKYRTIADTCLELVKDKRVAQEYFYTQLDHQITRLPTQCRCENGTRVLKNLSACLTGLGPSVKLMCTTGSRTIELLLRSLADSMIINRQKLMISSGDPLKSVTHCLRKMKLQQGVSEAELHNLCRQMARLGGIEMIDMAHHIMRQEKTQKRSSLHLILGYLLAETDEKLVSPDDPIILMLTEYLIKETNRSCVIYVKTDKVMPAMMYDNDWTCVIESLCLINLAVCMKFLEKTANRSHISTQCLCTVLMQTLSDSWTVKESAEFALQVIAVGQVGMRKQPGEESHHRFKRVEDATAEMLKTYSSHILNKVSVACNSAKNYHMAPILMKAYLKKTRVSEEFDAFRVIVEKMLYALDRNQQKFTWALMKALLEFMKCLQKDYPDLKPLPPPEDSEDQKDLPTPQHQTVEKILLRTKHMLTTGHLPVRLTALYMLHIGIHFLKHFDDMLLPMIHQNWYALMVICRNKDPTSTDKVIGIVLDMAELSKSFVHNKVLKEFWPIMEPWMTTLMKRNDDFKHLSEYSVAMKMVHAIPELCVYSGFTEEEFRETFMKLLDTGIEHQNMLAIACGIQKKSAVDYYQRGIPLDEIP